MYHPEHREIKNELDVYLKISDILYFYKIGKYEKNRIMKQLNLLKLVVKKNFNRNDLLNLIDEIKKLLEEYDKESYDIYIKNYSIEEKVKNNSILKFIK